MDTIAIIFARLGPYHFARLNAAARVLGEHGIAVVAVEIAREDGVNNWDLIPGEGDFRRITLFPEGTWTELTSRAIVRAVTAELDAIRPQTVAVPGWHFPEAIAGLRWARRRGAHAVVMSETLRQDTRRRWWREAAKRFMLRGCGAAMVGGERHAEYMCELGIPRDRIFLGYDVVDNDYFARGAAAARVARTELSSQFGLPDKYFMALCRFIPEKNLLRLIEGYSLYKRRYPAEAWRLVLCGDGPLRGDVLNIMGALGLGGNVDLPGYVSYARLPVYYGLASAFIHASSVEPWGLVVNEAMAAGLPVLVSDHCGCAELVRDGMNGFTFDPYDVEAVAGGMIELHGRQHELPTMGATSRRIIAEWAPDRFGLGLWEAVQATQHRR